MIELVSDRWYIEDQIRPSLGRKINFVVDLYTDESLLKVPILRDLEDYLLELEVRGVNLGRELSYIEEDNYLIIDLGDLNSWTSIKNSQGLTKVRLDFKFTKIEHNFDISPWDLGYQTFFEVMGYKMDKGSITLPLGTKMADNSAKMELLVDCKGEIRKYSEKIRADYVDTHMKKKRYHFTVKRDIKEILGSEKCVTEFKVSYRVVNEKKFYIVPLISFSLMILALTRFYNMISGTITFDIRYLAAAVAFLGLILNFVREGYEIPLRKPVFLAIIILVIELALELIFLPYGKG